MEAIEEVEDGRSPSNSACRILCPQLVKMFGNPLTREDEAFVRVFVVVCRDMPVGFLSPTETATVLAWHITPS